MHDVEFHHVLCILRTECRICARCVGVLKKSVKLALLVTFQLESKDPIRRL